MGIKKNFLVDAGLEANLASSFANTVAVTGAVTFSNTLATTGNATFSNTLAVTGNVTFSNTLSVGNIVSALTVGGLLTGASGLSITGTSNTTVAYNVGANVSLTTVRLAIGNSSVNTVVNATAIDTDGTLAVLGAATFSNTVTIAGDLTVSGTTTYVNTATLNVADNIITLNTDWSGAPSENAGIEVNRGSSANVQFMWDETNDRWSSNGQPLAVAALSTSGVYTASANINLSNNHLINSRLTRYTESVTANTTGVGSSYAIDLSTANIFDLTLSANVTFSVTNPPASGIAQGATIILRQDATGGRTVTFPSSFKTTDGIAANSAISTGANRIDVFTIITVDGGTVYLASQAMANVG